MEDRDAELAVLVNVGVIQRVGELELRWRVRVIGWKFHASEKVTAVVEGIRVDDDEGDFPVENIVFLQLQGHIRNSSFL